MTKVYERDVVGLGLSGRYYYCAKVEVLPNGMRKVVGKKRDVTESIEALLKKRIKQTRTIEAKGRKR